MQLRESDVEKLRRQGWAAELGFEPWVEFRGVRYLRQREDGACVFLREDGLCEIHARAGLAAKPVACQMFPFSLTPVEGAVQIGMSFACPSAIENRGAELSSHLEEIRRLVREIPEARPGRGVVLRDGIALAAADVQVLASAFAGHLRCEPGRLRGRVLGCVLLTRALREERAIEKIVAGGKFGDMLVQLTAVLDEEVASLSVAAPTTRQMKQMRQFAYAHIEDVKIGEVSGGIVARQRRALRQLRINRRFSVGKGRLPEGFRVAFDWPDVTTLDLRDVSSVAGLSGADAAWGEEAVSRWLRGRVLGGRAWGAGYYGFDALAGLETLWLEVAAMGWLARLHAAARGVEALATEDVEAAILRVDRAAGRAPWLGSAAERLRLRYLREGLEALVGRWWVGDVDQ